MHVVDFASIYRGKTDEELLGLAEQSKNLMEEARHALAAELAVRRLSAESCEAFARNDEAHLEPTIAKPAATELPTRQFIEEVFRFYSRNRWLFMKLAFPAVFVGTAAIIATRYELRDIQRQLFRNVLQPRVAIYEASAWEWGRNLVSWLALSMSFAAISVATEQIVAGFTATIRESFEAVLNRFITLLWVSLLLLVLLFGVEGGIVLVSQIGFDAFQPFIHAHPLTIWVVTYMGGGIACLVVSRFSLAIPAVVLDDCRVGQGMFRSDELTRGKWSILVILLLKSVMGGYVAAMLPFWLARLIFSSVQLPPGFGWVLTAASVAAVTTVEPLMFIGFALLYVKTTAVSVPANLKAVSAT